MTPVLAGAPLAGAAGAMILIHGRGGSAADILGLGAAIAPPNWALVAPRVAGNSWYPYSFLAPREENEPNLTDALAAVRAALETALAAGVELDRIVFAGFSQGACLSTEFVGRNPARYGGLMAFTGGLIGPVGTPLLLTGDLAGMPALLSAADPDIHVPWSRVEESARLLSDIGANITLRHNPGQPHTVSAAEVAVAREMMAAIG